MLTLLWNLSAAIRGYLRFYMPTNRAVDWLGSPSGLKWGIPVALVATPAYFALTALAIEGAARPGLGWLNVLVFLFFWDAMKFAALGVLSPVLLIRTSLSAGRLAKFRRPRSTIIARDLVQIDERVLRDEYVLSNKCSSMSDLRRTVLT